MASIRLDGTLEVLARNWVGGTVIDGVQQGVLHIAKAKASFGMGALAQLIRLFRGQRGSSVSLQSNPE